MKSKMPHRHQVMLDFIGIGHLVVHRLLRTTCIYVFKRAFYRANAFSVFLLGGKCKQKGSSEPHPSMTRACWSWPNTRECLLPSKPFALGD